MGVRRRLTEADREEISRGIAERVQGRVIAERIGRDPSVVCRDIARHGGRAGYRGRRWRGGRRRWVGPGRGPASSTRTL